MLDAHKPSPVMRKARQTDARGILDCLRIAFGAYRRFYTAEAFADTTLTPETLQERFTRMTIFVALDSSGEVIGTIACNMVDSGEGHIRGMAVLPGCRGTGIAEQLLHAAEEELRTRGCSRVTLDTTAPLRRAIRFYERNGFQASGRIGDFFGMPLFEYVKELS